MSAGVFMVVFKAAGHACDAHAMLQATRIGPGRCCQYLLAEGRQYAQF